MGVSRRRYTTKDGKVKTSKGWYCSFMYRGERFTPRKIENSAGLTKREAEKICQQIKEEEIARIEEEERRATSGEDEKIFDFAMAEYYTVYLNKLEARRSKSHKEIQDTWHFIIKGLQAYFGGMLITDITARVIFDFIKHRREMGNTDRTIEKYLRGLSVMFNHAVAINLCSPWDVPNFQNIKKNYLAKNVRRTRYLSPEEYDVVLPDMRNEVGMRAAYVIVETGLRPGECLYLWEDHLNFSKKQVAVLDTKNGYNRIVDMNKKAEHYLQEQLQWKRANNVPGPYVFPHPDGTPLNNFRKSLRNAALRNGIEDVRPHDLRRTFGTWRKLGIRGPKLDIYEICRALGHSNVTTTTSFYVYLKEEGIKL